MTYLLDVNVLIALIDPGHVQHDIAPTGRHGRALGRADNYLWSARIEQASCIYFSFAQQTDVNG